MNKIHYIIAAVMTFFIIAKLSTLLAGQDFGLPKELHVLRTISSVALFISISLSISTHYLTKPFILSTVLLYYTDIVWRYFLNDIGIVGLLLFILGYSFIPYILWTSYKYDWATKSEVKATTI